MPGLFQQGQCDVMYTNTQTVGTLRGQGVDIEFRVSGVRRHRLLHDDASRQGRRRAGKRLQVSRHGDREGRAGS